MGDLIIPLDVLLAVVGLLLIALMAVFARRTVLSRGLGTFDCSLRHETIRRRGPWIHGIARYGDDRLDWFRMFAVRFRAAESLARGRLVILDRRDPAPEESPTVLPDSVIVRCAYGAVIVELAMSEGAYNGLAAWLESAPPGQHISIA